MTLSFVKLTVEANQNKVVYQQVVSLQSTCDVVPDSETQKVLVLVREEKRVQAESIRNCIGVIMGYRGGM